MTNYCKGKFCYTAKKKSKGGSKSVVVSSIEPESDSDEPSPAEYEDDTEFANMLRGKTVSQTTIVYCCILERTTYSVKVLFWLI
jgi:hypothetical protein